MKIKMFFDEEGNITFDYEGFQGKVCIEEFQELIKHLKTAGIDIQINEQNFKQEYYLIRQKEEVKL